MENVKPGADKSIEEITALVKDNMGLVWHFVKKYAYLKDLDLDITHDDLVNMAEGALAKAARHFVPGQGKFGNYASIAIDNAMKTLVSNEHDFYAHHDMTLQSPIGDDEGESDSTKLDKVIMKGGKPTIATDDDLARETSGEGEHAMSHSEAEELIDSAMAALPARDRQAVKLWLAGETFREIGPKIGVSHAMAGGIVNKSFEVMRRWFEKKGFTNIEDIILLSESLDNRGIQTKVLLIASLMKK
jgi:RNA polymerase sigma factor (sigma-70 family)